MVMVVVMSTTGQPYGGQPVKGHRCYGDRVSARLVVGEVAARRVQAGSRRKPAQSWADSGNAFGHWNPLEGVVEVPLSPSLIGSFR